MCDCGCGCDFLICDFTFLFIRIFSEKILDKNPRTSIIFVIRCLFGLLFDAIEYAILIFTADNIDYYRFKVIFIVFSVFVVFIFLSTCCKKEVFVFIFTLFFKCITLSVAISIFTTTSKFEWETIETSVTTIDSAEDFFTALLITVSFTDICFIIINLILKVGYIGFYMIGSEKGCCETFGELMCKPAGQVGLID